MTGSIVRALVALLFAGLLWAQARGVRGQPRRRRAFELAAGAVLALAALQIALAAGATYIPLLYLAGALALVLLVAALASLVSSLRGGELRGQGDQVAEAARQYRERREEQERREQR